MKGEFYTTRDLFKNFIDFDEPLSYREWLSVDDSYKVAVLYLQFFVLILKCNPGIIFRF